MCRLDGGRGGGPRDGVELAASWLVGYNLEESRVDAERVSARFGNRGD